MRKTENIRPNNKDLEEQTNSICTNEYGFIIQKLNNKSEQFEIKKDWYAIIDEYEFDIEKFKEEIRRKLESKTLGSNELLSFITFSFLLS